MNRFAGVMRKAVVGVARSTKPGVGFGGSFMVGSLAAATAWGTGCAFSEAPHRTSLCEGSKAPAAHGKGSPFHSEGNGFGQRPCVLVIDFCKAYTQSDSPWYCGNDQWSVVCAVAESVDVIEKARQQGVPVIYTTVIFDDNGLDEHLMFLKKVPSIRVWTKDNPLTHFCPEIAPKLGDRVINKKHPGAFWGTPLATHLASQGIDTCLLIGCSTSGCIRATAVEGMQHGYHMVIPRECVGDRTKAVQDANLLDINAKVCDVTSKAAVMEYLASLPPTSTDH